jgi:hypothetical protein
MPRSLLAEPPRKQAARLFRRTAPRWNRCAHTSIVCPRALAQPATASRPQMLTVRSRRSRSGRGVAGFKSCHSDQFFQRLMDFRASPKMSARQGNLRIRGRRLSTQPNTIFSVLIDGRRRLRSASCGGPNQRIAGSVIRREPYSSSATIESLARVGNGQHRCSINQRRLAISSRSWRRRYRSRSL